MTCYHKFVSLVGSHTGRDKAGRLHARPAAQHHSGTQAARGTHSHQRPSYTRHEGRTQSHHALGLHVPMDVSKTQGWVGKSLLFDALTGQLACCRSGSIAIEVRSQLVQLSGQASALSLELRRGRRPGHARSHRWRRSQRRLSCPEARSSSCPPRWLARRLWSKLH